MLFSDNRDSAESLLSELTLDDWKRLLSLASLQGVLPIVIQFLETRKIEDDSIRKVIIEWYGKAQKNRQDYRSRLSTMRELAEMLAGDGIDVMFFKGAALAQLYLDPEWRVFSDIDFYLFGRCVEGNKVLARHGIESRPYFHHNTEASMHGILLENHYDFVERLNHRHNLVLDDELKKLASEEGKSRKASFLDTQADNAYVMTPTMNAIFLMRHMSAHFVSESIPLRMLYDWALFLKNDSKNVDWEIVVGLYDKSGMTEFVEIVQCILKKKLGVEYTDCPVLPSNEEKVGKVWQSIISPPECDPYKKYSLSYYLFETKTFWNNRWKHRIVYPGESYFFLFLRYAWSVLKKKQ